MANLKNLMTVGYPSEELWGYPRHDKERIDFLIEADIVFSLLLDHNREDYEQQRITNEIQTMLDGHLLKAGFELSHAESRIINNIEEWLSKPKLNRGEL